MYFTLMHGIVSLQYVKDDSVYVPIMVKHNYSKLNLRKLYKQNMFWAF